MKKFWNRWLPVIVLAAASLSVRALDLPWERGAPPAPTPTAATPSPKPAPVPSSTREETAFFRSMEQTVDCRMHMEMIWLEKTIWENEKKVVKGTPMDIGFIASRLPDGLPRCPTGGRYSVGAVGENPSCSVHGRLPDSLSAPNAEPMDDATTALLADAERGDAGTQWRLGLLYYYGKGVRRDRGAAVKWFRRAADQGHAWGQTSLGFAHWGGQDVPEDLAEALRWFRRAAAQGHAIAAVCIGNAYEMGDGVPRNPALAADWYRRVLVLEDDSGRDEARKGLERLAEGTSNE